MSMSRFFKLALCLIVLGAVGVFLAASLAFRCIASAP